MHSSYCDIYIPYEIKDELYIKRVYFTLLTTSDVTARPESRGPAQAEPCEAKLYEAPTGLPGAYGSGFTFLEPQAVA